MMRVPGACSEMRRAASGWVKQPTDASKVFACGRWESGGKTARYQSRQHSYRSDQNCGSLSSGGSAYSWVARHSKTADVPALG